MTPVASPDTIAAIATPPGRGGIGVVRVSGTGAADIARTLVGRLPRPRHATLAAFLDADGETIDQGLALYFPAPASFTGEDVLELQGHGGIQVMERLLARVLSLGARLAEPGEFTQRAFLNGKIDLVQAEAIADLIDSGSRAAARAAMRSLTGLFSRQVRALAERITTLRVMLEAALDFPEEDGDFALDAVPATALDEMQRDLARLLQDARQGRLLQEGMNLVIAGQPNAGKSSLLNALAGYEAAIVTPVAGTTRDLVREQVAFAGVPVQLVDTAGLREAGDGVEAEGVRRAWQAIARADRVLLLVDDARGWDPGDQAILDRFPDEVEVTLVYNKIDLSGRPPGPVADSRPPALAVSARTGAGLAALQQSLVQAAGGTGEGVFIARRRHLDALHRTQAHLRAARARCGDGDGIELVAEELRLGQAALGEITGEVTPDDLLGEIFSQFCIGK